MPKIGPRQPSRHMVRRLVTLVVDHLSQGDDIVVEDLERFLLFEFGAIAPRRYLKQRLEERMGCPCLVCRCLHGHDQMAHQSFRRNQLLSLMRLFEADPSESRPPITD